MRDDWDLPRLRAWTDYSSTHQPLNVMVSAIVAYLGIKPAAKPQDTALANEEAAAFLLGLPELGRK